MRADLRAAIYLRVSTPGQVERGTSLDTQERQARDMCGRHGWQIVSVIADRGASGRRTDRPGIQALLELAREGRIDVVVPTTADRFGRSLLDSLLLQRELTELGVAVLSVDGRLDSLSDHGRFTSTIWGAIAEEESRTIARRTSQGRIAATREGRFTGSTPPWGWTAVPAENGRGKKLVPDPKAATAIRRLVQLLDEGTAYGDTARILTAEGHLRPGNGRSGPSPWTAATLRRWVRTRGTPTADATWSLGGVSTSIPPILDRDQADALRRLVALTPAQPQRKNEPSLLRGRVISPCSAVMQARVVVHPSGRRQRPVYTCPNKLAGGGHRRCHCDNVPIDIVDAAVWHEVSALLTDDAALMSMAREAIGAQGEHDDTSQLEEQIERLRAEITETHQAARARGLDPVTALALLDPMQAEMDDLNKRLSAAQRRRSARAGRDRTRLRDTVRELRAAVVVADEDRRRELLAALDTHVHVDTRPCAHCGGTGYLPFEPGDTRRRPTICPECQRMKVTVGVRIEVDDVAAVSLVRSATA